MHYNYYNITSFIPLGPKRGTLRKMGWIHSKYGNKFYFKISLLNQLILVVLFCLAAVIFPLGFHVDEIGGQPYQLPNSHQVGVSYILFVLALWITVISELFAGKVCLPHF